LVVTDFLRLYVTCAFLQCYLPNNIQLVGTHAQSTLPYCCAIHG